MLMTREATIELRGGIFCFYKEVKLFICHCKMNVYLETSIKYKLDKMLAIEIITCKLMEE